MRQLICSNPTKRSEDAASLPKRLSTATQFHPHAKTHYYKSEMTEVQPSQNEL